MATPRTCIKCKEPMSPHVVSGVEIDHCAGCGGLWLDAGEIKTLAAQPAVALEAVRALDNRSASVNSTDPGLTSGLLDTPCPACGGKLVHAVFGETGVEHCNGCFGLFLDRGELVRTMELVDTTAATTIVALAKSVQTSGTI